MKRIAKTLIIMLLVLTMPLGTVTALAAENESAITPRLSHINDANMQFSVENNQGYASLIYNCYSSIISVDLHIKVEKRFLLAFWNDIDEWSTTSTNPRGVIEHYFTLNGNGTYRATFTLEVTGSDGTVDVITDTITDKLN